MYVKLCFHEDFKGSSWSVFAGCEGVVEGELGCCKGQLYDLSIQECCDFTQVYDPSLKFCCGALLWEHMPHRQCCALAGNARPIVFDSQTKICCGGALIQKGAQACCPANDVANGTPYDPATHWCCRNDIRTRNFLPRGGGYNTMSDACKLE